MVKWLHENRTERYSADNIMDEIALAGHVEILEWFEQNTSERCSNTVLERVDNLQVIKYLHERNEGETNRFGFSTDTMDNTCSLDAIKWLHENRTEGCTEKAFFNAIKNNNSRVLQWLLDNRTEYTKQSMENDIDKLLVQAFVAESNCTLKWMLYNLTIPIGTLLKYKEKYSHAIEPYIVLVEYLSKLEKNNFNSNNSL
ncbi:hypothetical protein PPL_11982 [Heterostelium album PN500]|uniref:Ankyrin repeat protein n=1 Tax=Heterostelium pallidum (strain ATCC 26659 / Pp 5 / PN500) TaxID=670386 RepID=D3BV10_HETP5|nr:hypothetical protein PPL_11982 [Heterostelium album PN500]EFA74948.1 hypothetical protein PPL_11982 [Heterostelium album PN500]|eukprot:XP_020427082.1 hypothetical protein PPL_11982 [Heterostelium album PN500]